VAADSIRQANPSKPAPASPARVFSSLEIHDLEAACDQEIKFLWQISHNPFVVPNA
jgi:hypothetical protein